MSLANILGDRFYNTKLKIEASGGLAFNASKSMSIETKTKSIFIQTDKVLYKPGQTGKIYVWIKCLSQKNGGVLNLPGSSVLMCYCWWQIYEHSLPLRKIKSEWIWRNLCVDIIARWWSVLSYFFWPSVFRVKHLLENGLEWAVVIAKLG